MAFRPFLLAAAIMPLSLVACGGDDGGTIVPEGTHYKYVVNKAFVPTTNNQAHDYGLDLNDDGQVDNQLGMVLSTITGFGFNVQATIDAAVAEGSIVLLVDFQTKDFTNTTAAGIQVFLGDSPTPAPCNNGEMYDEATMSGCGHHLDGTGMFSIASGSPTNAALGGKIIAGKFTSQTGNLSLQIALGGTEAIQLDLIGARAEMSSISEAMIGSGTTGGITIAGAVTKEDIDNQVIPAVHKQLEPTIQEDCPGTTAPDCGCMADSTGKQILSLFDKMPVDCKVSVEEIKTSSFIASVLAPDVTIDGVMALSLGLKATAKKGEFTVPGQ